MKIQNYRNSIIFENYEAAVNYIQTVLVNDKTIVDGQEIFVRYNHNGKVVTIIAAAYVDGNGNVSFSIVNDGMSIISSSEEPGEEYRDNYIWIQETDETQMLDDGVTYDLRSMQRAIAELYTLVDKFRYAFENEMNCGKVTDNSTRLQLMSEAEPVIPMGYEDGTIPFLLSTFTEGEIEEIITYFKANDNNESVIKDDTWETDIVSIELNESLNCLWVYKKVKYKSGQEVDTLPYLMTYYKENKFFQGFFDYYKLSQNPEIAPNKTEVTYSKVLLQTTEEYPFLYCYVECDYVKDENENKPRYYENSTPNVKHLIIKSAQTELEIKNNLLNLCDGELVWCEGNNGLYIRSKGRLVKINGANSSIGGENNDNNNDNIGDIMAGIITNGDYVGSIDFVSSSQKVYRMKVNDYGKMEVYTSNLDEPDPSIKGNYKPDEKMTKLFMEKLYINSFYCGGEGDDINEHSLRPCSHNFVELSNLTNNDINLNGFSLQYATEEGAWEVLPLWGIIPSNGTFLIRGAQCSIMEANTTVIKVKDFDMEWYVTKKVNGIDTKKLIQFNSTICKFYLTYGTKTNQTCPYATEVCYIDLTKSDVLPNIENYTPKTSKDKKNFYYNKTKLDEMKPSTVVVSFGIQATDNKENGGSGATRCFNWVSKGYYDEFVWYKKVNSTDDVLSLSLKDIDSSWTCIESYTGKDSELMVNNGSKHGYPTKEKSGQYYYRIKQETTNNELCTSHKVIVRQLSSGIYAYTCGKKDKSGAPLIDGCSDLRTFVVRTDAEVNNGYTFVHTSDQQGFNWDEYQVWYYAAKCIAERTPSNLTPQFTLNTGDATQNGNRISEWLDYFDGRTPLNNLEEVYTIGNNDLCPAIPYQLGGGNDVDKINPVNITYFYTFELDESNLPEFVIGSSKYYIPSLYSFNYGNCHYLCVNSEIAPGAETDLYGLSDAGNLYGLVKTWCENDMSAYKTKTNGWNIAYCHEMPYTILIEDTLKDYYDSVNKITNTSIVRGGSRLNTNLKDSTLHYWFGKFCKEYNIRLVMGGHKHTQAITWPLVENYGVEGKHNMQPTIQVTVDDLQSDFGCTTLTTAPDADLGGRKYPSTWFENGELKTAYKDKAHYCEFELVTTVTAPVYSMSQATGYKHTSNKELPAGNIPWCRYYYPKTESGGANTNQKMPFYTYVTVTNNQIELNVKRIADLMTDGKFNIYVEGERAKNNFDTQLKIQNGIAPGYETKDTKVIIKK